MNARDTSTGSQDWVLQAWGPTDICHEPPAIENAFQCCRVAQRGDARLGSHTPPPASPLCLLRCLFGTKGLTHADEPTWERPRKRQPLPSSGTDAP